MSSSSRPVAATLRLYRAMANAFPYEFKNAYREEMLQVTEDVVEPIWQRQWGVRPAAPAGRRHGSGRGGTLGIGVAGCAVRRASISQVAGLYRRCPDLADTWHQHRDLR